MVAAPRQEVIWEPQDGPQTAAWECTVPELFFGGARGGGKTDFFLGFFLYRALTYGHYAKGMFLRREAVALEKVIERSQELYPKAGAVWRGDKATWTFQNGATLKFRHLWDEEDANPYQGHDYTDLYFEELTQWPTDKAYKRMFGAMRSAGGVPVLVRANANPGGVGHSWVKKRFYDPAPGGYKLITDKKTGLQRVYIPARLEDNPALFLKDPDYEKRLQQVGSPTLVKAWRYGLWDIEAGAFFADSWNEERHILQPSTYIEFPPSWSFSRSFDWGSAKPAALGFWAESDGTAAKINGVDRFFPRGSLILFDELYTVAVDENGEIKPNEGQRLTARQLGAKIVEKSNALKKDFYGDCADPSIFTENGQASIHEEMQEGAKEVGGWFEFEPSDNSRSVGWQRCSQYLQESAKEKPESPGVWVTANCTEFLRTVPTAPRSKKQPDELDTECEDHHCDQFRYRLMRPDNSVTTTRYAGY